MFEFSVEEYLRGLSPICTYCGETCIEDVHVIKLADGKVSHGKCYSKVVGTFEDLKRKMESHCSECRKPFVQGDEAINLGLGQVFHAACYDIWLERNEKRLAPLRVGWHDVAVRLPGEERLSRDEIAWRRHSKLIRKRRRKPPRREPPQQRNARWKAGDPFVQRWGYRGRGRQGQPQNVLPMRKARRLQKSRRAWGGRGCP